MPLTLTIHYLWDQYGSGIFPMGMLWQMRANNFGAANIKLNNCSGVGGKPFMAVVLIC